ncbi:hypothetical protein, partial [Rhodopseudomonas palustris]|uniref:hypothetical protein n=1 Tax=Rhodopseudomonas palustris TaxID=1076 RepID=UPI001AECE4BC
MPASRSPCLTDGNDPAGLWLLATLKGFAPNGTCRITASRSVCSLQPPRSLTLSDLRRQKSGRDGMSEAVIDDIVALLPPLLQSL